MISSTNLKIRTQRWFSKTDSKNEVLKINKHLNRHFQIRFVVFLSTGYGSSFIINTSINIIYFKAIIETLLCYKISLYKIYDDLNSGLGKSVFKTCLSILNKLKEKSCPQCTKYKNVGSKIVIKKHLKSKIMY